MEITKKKIYCPRCHRQIGNLDTRSTIDVIANCRRCHRQIIYRIKTGETEVRFIPPRNSSSGMTFY